MTPFTVLVDTTETPLRKRRGLFVTKRKLGCMAISALVILISLSATIYHFSSLQTLKQFDNASLTPSHSFQNCSNNQTEFGYNQVDPNSKNDSDSHRPLGYQVQESSIKTGLQHKLPSSLRPLKYSIRLIPFLSGNFSVRGFVEITFECIVRTNKVTLHSKNIIIRAESVKIKKKNGSKLGILKQFYEVEKDFYVVVTDTDIVGSYSYSISMEFEGLMSDNGEGFYHSSYFDEFGKERRYALTHLWPNFAREVFPCFDEPSLRANFSIQIARKRYERVLSNMQRESVDPVIGYYGFYWDSFQTSPMMPTYSVAFLVSDFVPLNKNGSLKTWSRKSFISYTECAYEEGEKILKELGAFFGQPYPFSKLDIALVPGLKRSSGRGLGLITLRESDLLCQPSISSSGAHLTLLKKLRYSISQQWLGTLVPPAKWNQVWIAEGISTYLQYSNQNEGLFLSEIVQEGLNIDSLPHTHAVSVQLASAKDVGSLLPSVVTTKGAALFKMMEGFLTKETLRKGLSAYLRSPSFRSGVEDVLWRHLALQAQEDGIELPKNFSLKQAMDTWTLQSGYPLVHFSKMNGSFFLWQEKFSQASSANKSAPRGGRTRWYVPLTYTTQSHPEFSSPKPTTTWLVPTEDVHRVTDISTEDGWTIFNIQQSTFCRVSYDHDNWMALIYQLKTDHSVISAQNRAQLLDDSAALARSGLLSYDVTLTLFSYLKYEEEQLPWQTGLVNLNHLRLMFSRTAAQQPLRMFVLSRVITIYNKLEGEDRSDDLMRNRLRSLVMETACALQVKNCVERAVDLFKKWMAEANKESSLIDPDERVAVFCTAIARGGMSEWNFLWSYYKTSRTAPLQKDLLRALGCSTNEEILKRYLNMTLGRDESFNEEDIVAVMEGVAKEPIGKKVAWEFVRRNWQTLLGRFGHDLNQLEKIIYAVTGFINTQQYLYEFENFHEKYRKYTLESRPAMDQALEIAKLNMLWMKKHSGEIYQWLDDNGYTRL